MRRRRRRLLTRLAVTGWQRGLRDGSRPWLIVGMTASGLSALRFLLADRDQTAILELRRGEAVEIRALRADR